LKVLAAPGAKWLSIESGGGKKLPSLAAVLLLEFGKRPAGGRLELYGLPDLKHGVTAPFLAANE